MRAQVPEGGGPSGGEGWGAANGLPHSRQVLSLLEKACPRALGLRKVNIFAQKLLKL